MKRTIKLAVAAAVALTSTAAFATNGDHLIGMGAKARGMGGIGIGMSHGAETALSNPALITSVKGTEISFGGTVFMPDVETTMAGSLGGTAVKSDADLSVIPEVAVAQNLGNGISWGVGMYGVAGMGTDYRGTGMNADMVTNLQLMQFAVPVAYKTGGLSVGIAPVLQYGSLDINYDASAMNGNPAGTNLSTTQGVAQDFGVGYNVGLAYTEDGLTVGASYKSAINMNYKGQISQAMSDFTGAPASMFSDNLEQPAEMGVGASYVFGGNTVAVDYKRIKWSSARGYEDFQWDDQNVYMIGYQYAQDNWALRAGYNYAKSPIKEQAVGVAPTFAGGLVNTLNLLGFPAIVTKHYTVGGSYDLSKTTSLDLAYVYTPEVTEEFAIMTLGGPSTIKTSHSQDAVSAQINFNF